MLFGVTPSAPAISREKLIAAVEAFLGNSDAETREGLRADIVRVMDEAGPDALVAFNERFADAGTDWNYYPRDPLAREIHRQLAHRFLGDGSRCDGVHHVEAVAGRPVVIFANHLSYSDANLFEVLVSRAGGEALCDRLTVLAGPKVYSSMRRRFSSLCFGTIKVAQNSARSSEDAVMSAREVARAARRSIEVAHERLERGDALLLFAEGTRSRANGMQEMLPGATRYLDGPETWILPASIIGTEAMFPVGEDVLYKVPIVTCLGAPILARDLRAATGGDRRLTIDAIGLAIAQLLPPAYRGAYGEVVAGLDAAREVLARVWPASRA